MVSSFKDQNPRKGCLKLLLGLAQSDRERECIKYAASGMTSTRAHREYGFQCMTECATRVEQAIVEVQKIRKTVEETKLCWPVLEFNKKAPCETDPASPSACELSACARLVQTNLPSPTTTGLS